METIIEFMREILTHVPLQFVGSTIRGYLQAEVALEELTEHDAEVLTSEYLKWKFDRARNNLLPNN